MRLGEDDRKRLGCPEWLDLDLSKLMIDDAIALEEDAGIGPVEYKTLIAGKPVFEDGQPVLRPNGSQLRKHAAKTFKAVVWLALKRADIHVPWAELTFDFEQFETRSDENDAGGDDAEDKTPGPG
jgi:hypothetical protein